MRSCTPTGPILIRLCHKRREYQAHPGRESATTTSRVLPTYFAPVGQFRLRTRIGLAERLRKHSGWAEKGDGSRLISFENQPTFVVLFCY